jgi:hypothetical protein
MKLFSKITRRQYLALAVIASLQFGMFATAEESNFDLNSGILPVSVLRLEQPGPQVGSVIALNREMTAKDRTLSMGSELVIGDGGSLSAVEVNSNGEATGTLTDIGLKLEDLVPTDYTLLKQDETTGEIEDFSLPEDLQLAGPGGGRSKRHGVTNCFHVVKQIVRHRITLTGVAAYMAAPELRAAGWHRYASYSAAPMGSVCVFGAGGVHTTSGGQIYGHVGVKGAGGIANPMSGFHLKRPFLGCWNEH